jgi:hypothetical protein
MVVLWYQLLKSLIKITENHPERTCFIFFETPHWLLLGFQGFKYLSSKIISKIILKYILANSLKHPFTKF